MCNKKTAKKRAKKEAEHKQKVKENTNAVIQLREAMRLMRGGQSNVRSEG